MFDSCFIPVDPLILIAMALILTSYAIYKIFTVFRGEKTSFFVITLFLAMTAVSLVSMPSCWTIVISIIELAIALYLSKQKLLVLRTH